MLEGTEQSAKSATKTGSTPAQAETTKFKRFNRKSGSSEKAGSEVSKSTSANKLSASTGQSNKDSERLERGNAPTRSERSRHGSSHSNSTRSRNTQPEISSSDPLATKTPATSSPVADIPVTTTSRAKTPASTTNSQPSKTPTSMNPVAKSPVITTPVVKTPASATPAAKPTTIAVAHLVAQLEGTTTPVLKTPATAIPIPTTKTPTVSTPVATTLASTTPSAKTPVAKTPSLPPKSLASTNPVAKTPETSTPSLPSKTPASTTSEANTLASTNSAGKPLASSSSAAKNPATSNAVAKTAATTAPSLPSKTAPSTNPGAKTLASTTSESKTSATKTPVRTTLSLSPTTKTPTISTPVAENPGANTTEKYKDDTVPLKTPSTAVKQVQPSASKPLAPSQLDVDSSSRDGLSRGKVFPSGPKACLSNQQQQDSNQAKQKQLIKTGSRSADFQKSGNSPDSSSADRSKRVKSPETRAVSGDLLNEASRSSPSSRHRTKSERKPAVVAATSTTMKLIALVGNENVEQSPTPYKDVTPQDLDHSRDKRDEIRIPAVAHKVSGATMKQDTAVAKATTSQSPAKESSPQADSDDRTVSRIDVTRLLTVKTFCNSVDVQVNHAKFVCSGAILAYHSPIFESQLSKGVSIIVLEELNCSPGQEGLVEECLMLLYGGGVVFSNRNIDMMVRFAVLYQIENLYRLSLAWVRNCMCVENVYKLWLLGNEQQIAAKNKRKKNDVVHLCKTFIRGKEVEIAFELQKHRDSGTLISEEFVFLLLKFTDCASVITDLLPAYPAFSISNYS